MKQLRLYGYLIALLLGVNMTQAYGQAEVPGYKFEFSATWQTLGMATTTTYNTVGTGWGRFWEEGSGTAGRVAYSRNTSAANNHTTTGAIASSVYVSQTSNTRLDMLVTPLVKGHISLWAKKYAANANYTGYIKLWKMGRDEDEDGVYYYMLSSTPIKTVNLATTTYEEITADLGDYTYVGIEPQYCYFDDFSADYAKVDLQDKIVISSLSNANNPTSYDDADENGNVPIKFYFYVRNDGDRDESGNMKVRVYSPNGFDKTVELGEQSVKIGEAKQFGTSAAPSVNIAFPIADYPDPADYYAIASINGIETEPFRLFNRQISPNAYGATPSPKLSINQQVLLPDGATLKFQPASASRTVTITMQNTGTVPLTFSDIVVPDGFSTNLLTTTTVAKHATSTFTITSTNTTPGLHEGDFSFKTNGGDFTWHLSYEIADGFCENFETNSNPGYLVREGTAEWSASSWVGNMNIDDNRNAQQHPSTKAGKLILPLLEVKAGDVFSFDAARINKNIQTVDGEKVYPVTTVSNVKVYYSTDRGNWTLLKTITNDQLPTEATEYSNSLYYHFGTYTIDGLPAGNYYLAFTGDSIYLDNLYGKVGYKQVDMAHNLAVTSFSIPDEGTVNSVYKASATLYNGGAAIEPATYTAKLYFGDEVVAETSPVELAASASFPMTAQRFSFSMTPHQAGTYQARIEFETEDGYIARSADVEVTVAPENGVMDLAIGESTAAYEPFSNGVIQYEAVYPKELINLPVGTQIKSLTYKGYVTAGSMGNPTPATYDFKVFVESTDDEAYATPYVMSSTADMTKVLDKEISFEIGTGSGSYDSQLGRYTVTEAADLIRANLANPITYDGKGLRVVIYAERSVAGTSVFLATDYSINDKAISKGAYSAETFENTAISARQLPVLYLGVDVEATTVTGLAYDATTALPLEGVSIDLQSNVDDVDYKATTNALGVFEIEMYQTQRNFHERVEKVGYYPLDSDYDVNGNVVRNLAMTPATGLNIEETDLPDGEVNSVYTATALASNFTTATVAAGDYTAKLYVDGEAVAEAAAEDVESLSQHTFTFSYTPHQAGTFPAYIELNHTNGTVAKSDVVDITVGEEVNNTVHQVGTPQSETATTAGVFAYTGYTHGLVELYYSEAELQAADVQVGDIIRGVTVKGYSNVTTPSQYNARVYLQHTGKTTPVYTNSTNFTLNDTTQMKKAYEGVITVEAKGLSNNLANYYELSFAEGFEYQGGNLVFTVATDGLTTATANPWLLYDKSGNGYALYAYYYNNNTSTKHDRAYKTNRAVLFLDVDRFRTLDGTVTATATDEPVAGASITLKNGDVEYYGVTDADGSYSIKVGKFGDDYVATYTADGYDDVEEDVSFATGNQTINVTLDQGGTYDREFTAGGYSTVCLPFALNEEQAAAAGLFYTLDGQSSDDALYFKKATTVEPNIPYVFIPASDGLLFHQYEPTVAYNPQTITRNGISFVGVGHTMQLISDATTSYYGFRASDHQFVKAGTTNGMKTYKYRAYISIPAGSEAKLSYLVVFDDGATGIDTVDSQAVNDGGKVQVYDLQGRRVADSLSGLRQGIYVVNGKKVIVK